MKTAKELGYKIGDRFTVVGGGTFSLGSVVELYGEDDSTSPLFKLIEGGCGFKCCDGERGAYLSLEYVKPLAKSRTFKVGDKVVFFQDTKTDDSYITSDAMIDYLERGTTLVVLNVAAEGGILCSPVQGCYEHAYHYHPDDLKHLSEHEVPEEPEPVRTTDELIAENKELNGQLAELIENIDIMSERFRENSKILKERVEGAL